MRRNFAEVLQSAGVDIGVEYESLYCLVFERYGLYSLMESNFRSVTFAGTAISLEDFNNRYRFDVESFNYAPTQDDLLGFCEYFYNFAFDLRSHTKDSSNDCCGEVIRHIEALADKLSHVVTDNDGFKILVPMNANVQAAAEVAPLEVGLDLVKYDYRNYDGDLGGKKKILLHLLNYLEPKRKQLEVLAKDATNDLFFMANSLNLRHNNVDPQDATKYKKVVAEMDEKELEEWYDLCRDLCAVAILLLSYGGQKQTLSDLKARL